MLSRLLCPSLTLLLVAAFPAAAHDEEPPILLGRCSVEQLDQQPFAEWWRKGYEEYAPDPAILERLRETDVAGATFTVFLGTWCGDSQREVPRMLRLFDALGVARERVALIAVDRTDTALKQSPDHEERGREIYRVPTLIVERDGEEIARLVEYPVSSLERDLLAMLSGRDYAPAYGAYPVIRRWLAEGLLHDPNVSPWGLAGQLRSLINGEGDLPAVARVLEARGDPAAALKLYRVDCALHRESAGCHERLAAALLASGDVEGARDHARRALGHNDDPDRLQRLTELIEAIGRSGS